jgi:hypothetical protein
MEMAIFLKFCKRSHKNAIFRLKTGFCFKNSKKRCVITDNSAQSSSGGMYNDHSSPTVTGCTFADNSVTYGGSGGMYNSASSPNCNDCTFTVTVR